MKTFAVYYMNQDYFSFGILGKFDDIDPKNLRKTHIYLKEVTTGSDNGAKELVFEMMNWGHKPTPEQMITLDLTHQGMSMGDILVDKDTNQVYVCSAFGWKELI